MVEQKPPNRAPHRSMLTASLESVEQIVQAQIASLEAQIEAVELHLVANNPNEATTSEPMVKTVAIQERVSVAQRGEELENDNNAVDKAEQMHLLARQREALEQVRNLQRENEELKRQIEAQQAINERLEQRKSQIDSEALGLQPQELVGDEEEASRMIEAQLNDQDQPRGEESLGDEDEDGFDPDQFDLESEAIIEWHPHENNKMQIKYYDASTEDSKGNDPIEFFLDVTDKFNPMDSNSLSFNRLILKESVFTEEQWFHLRLMLSHRFSRKLKRLRLWNCSLKESKDGDQETKKQKFDTCMAQLFKAVEDRLCILEIDLQYVHLGSSAITLLGQLLQTVKNLKRFTYITDGPQETDPTEMSFLLLQMCSNDSMQLETLVFYGLDFSTEDSARSLAHFMARQRRLRILRLQENCLQGQALFAIVTSLRKSYSIRSLEKLMLSLNQLDTRASVVTLCGLVKEAKKLRSLCTFYTGVILQWTNAGEDKRRDCVIALDEKRNQEHFRLQW